MAYATYFEIGGHVLESYIDSQDRVTLPNAGMRPAGGNYLLDKGKQAGVPKPLMRKGAKELEKSTGVDLMRIANAPGRVRRASWAFRTAAALAVVDGPLPIGDALAAGLLVTYGTYETVMIVKDVKEGVGY